MSTSCDECVKEGLPAVVDEDIWKRVTKGQAGARWDSAVEKHERT